MTEPMLDFCPSSKQLAETRANAPGRPVAMGDTAMKNAMSRFLADESGATAIEYGLIVALIAVVIITAVTTLGTKLNAAFGSINSKLP